MASDSEPRKFFLRPPRGPLRSHISESKQPVRLVMSNDSAGVEVGQYSNSGSCRTTQSTILVVFSDGTCREGFQPTVLTVALLVQCFVSLSSSVYNVNYLLWLNGASQSKSYYRAFSHWRHIYCGAAALPSLITSNRWQRKQQQGVELCFRSRFRRKRSLAQ